MRPPFAITAAAIAALATTAGCADHQRREEIVIHRHHAWTAPRPTERVREPDEDDSTYFDHDAPENRVPKAELEGSELPPAARVRRREQLGDVRPGRYPLAFLGVRFHAPSDSYSYRSYTEGVRVQEVLAGTAASRAGLKVGDIILAVGGIEVKTPEDLMLAVRVREVGEEIEITYLRHGQKRTVKVRLGFRSRPT